MICLCFTWIIRKPSQSSVNAQCVFIFVPSLLTLLLCAFATVWSVFLGLHVDRYLQGMNLLRWEFWLARWKGRQSQGKCWNSWPGGQGWIDSLRPLEPASLLVFLIRSPNILGRIHRSWELTWERVKTNKCKKNPTLKINVRGQGCVLPASCSEWPPPFLLEWLYVMSINWLLAIFSPVP